MQMCGHHQAKPQQHATLTALQVGIVRQTETAAIKKAEGSRGTFDRKLTAVYTSATLEASMHRRMHAQCTGAMTVCWYVVHHV
jgi:DNA mismatch repair ATPase MutS